ncbi:MAG TPA: hypothetical protein P5320_03770 [Bacteroidales bacterium]|nr:hypothetical protein [Bacteroidales bacterium]HOK73890.1 hypothetical protein [Bacteroidales bacterium]HOM39622.1 hypothetical protein [Bacteroidales bacterium]HOU31020.1 hypothetical protein [Bacteroidales bacterium]HPP91630.1 hypothetical protein [Bacteroidales bacterium]
MKTKNRKPNNELPVFKPEEILSINEMRFVYGGNEDGDGGEDIIIIPPPPPKPE